MEKTMNWKRVLLGTVVFWLVSNILGLGLTGWLIHEKVLDSEYQAHEKLWLPELVQDPPDMASLMPKWLLLSFVSSLVVATIYNLVRGSFAGPGWRRGLSLGACLGIFASVSYFSLTGMIAMSTKIALWWSLDALLLFLASGAAMGWAVGKWAED